MRATDFITELFNPESGYKIEWDDTFGPKEMHAAAQDSKGRIINITFTPVSTESYDTIDVEFVRGGSHGITGGGEATQVFATVINAINTYLTKYHRPAIILFSAKEGSRQKLYQSMIARLASRYGYAQLPYNKLPDEILEIPGLPKDVFALAKA